MIGNIIGIEENVIKVNISIDLSTVQNLINLHVLMDDGTKKVIGEIIDIKDNIAYINMIGELINGEFVFGVIAKPSFASKVALINKERISNIISYNNPLESSYLYIGKSPIYDNVDIKVEINQYFSNHFAIFGSTGSGKSCSVARIFQNLFEKQNSIPYKASMLIFDAYGEYHSAFSELNKKVPEINFKAYTTNLKFSETDILRIPLWLLSVDDIALLLGAETHGQLPIIEKALKLVTVFGREESLVIRHKNDIIARALLDVLSSGNPAVQIRDQIFSVLSYYNTSELNLDTPIYQPGYTRPFKQCLQVDQTGKIREMELIVSFIGSFLTENLDLNLPDGTFKYTLKHLKDAFDFALIAEGVLSNNRVYEEANSLKVRLHSLVNSEYSNYFDYPEFITKEQYIRDILTAPNGKKAQIINFNINYIDDRLAKTITKIYSRLVFEYAKDLDSRASMPFHIILEEAHRYVQNDSDINLLGYNIFERITKEGRKYGVLLGLISQRPSELSETTLSQCSNFLIFKMLHPRDIEYIKEMVPNITSEVVKRLRILQPGNCIGFGSAFKVPVLIKMDMPSPAPSSNSCDVSKAWFIDK